ncbi:heavy metal-binding domain-containing protein [Mycobacterium sp. 1245111.1]|uniref:heavy metal-binding domain-containing protein n=1 Tax=Mycobacterium sp. 1245111.1 TaxID=1834073 RepID=UPI0007FC9674|nr:heavy metal-binding domain-containing protein [Mycobacterium sp. 1245111.1]OBK35187.1 heavy metal-binding domain-containing protein [Mycobacterium sp. 1245111.1]
MNTAGRLAAFGAALVVAFGGGYVVAAAIAPGNVVATGHAPSAGHSDHDMAEGEPAGVALERDGYVLSPISAPDTVGSPGELSFAIAGRDGAPFTDFGLSHHKALHLIVVRADGSQFRHVHPTLNRTNGVWTMPWQWNAAGTYRVFADFISGDGDHATAVTLTRAVEVAGDFVPVPPTATRTVDSVDGFTVSLDGGLVAGMTSSVTATVVRDGAPVVTLEPYLGAFGHLVALRDGDLAFEHMHPHGDEPAAGQKGGPTVAFMAEVPTAGRYLLYLDFQVAGQVHTAHFVVDATRPPEHVHPAPGLPR